MSLPTRSKRNVEAAITLLGSSPSAAELRTAGGNLNAASANTEASTDSRALITSIARELELAASQTASARTETAKRAATALGQLV